jgi:hypothetical protein
MKTTRTRNFMAAAIADFAAVVPANAQDTNDCPAS